MGAEAAQHRTRTVMGADRQPKAHLCGGLLLIGKRCILSSAKFHQQLQILLLGVHNYGVIFIGIYDLKGQHW